MLTAQDVVSCYKLILGREPESAEVIQNYVDHSNFEHLRRTLLGSGELAEHISRDPSFLAVPAVALTLTDEMGWYQWFVEAVISLELPLRDQSTLIVGDKPACLLDFFLDRRCKVSVAASENTRNLLERVLRSNQVKAANTSVLSDDFATSILVARGRHELVIGALPDENTDVMRTWLDNAAEVCSGICVVAYTAAPGKSEDVFLTPFAREPHKHRAVPTKSWVASRLHERFEHLYRARQLPVGRSEIAHGGFSSSGETQTLYVASRHSLKSSALEEVATKLSSGHSNRDETAADSRMRFR